MITNAEIAVIRKMLRKTKEKTAAAVEAKLATYKEGVAHPKTADLVAIQNVFRDVLTVMLNEVVPYDDAFVGDLALRCVSYIISVVPLERQEVLLQAVAQNIAIVHMRRIREGVYIESQWTDDHGQGSIRNIPRKQEVN